MLQNMGDFTRREPSDLEKLIENIFLTSSPFLVRTTTFSERKHSLLTCLVI